MSKGPSLFSDIGQKARDLLTGDFNADQKLSVSTYGSLGVVLTSSAGKKGGLSTGDFGASYKSKRAMLDVKVDTASTIATKFTFNVYPSLKALALVKLPDYSFGKLEVQYLDDYATFTTAVAPKKSPVVDVSFTLGNPIFTAGIGARYDTSTGELKCTSGVEAATPDCSCSMIICDDQDSMKVSIATNVGKLKRTILGVEFHRVLSLGFPTDLSTVTIGCSHIVDPLTRVKVKLNNVGQLAAVLQHEVIPKSLLTVSTEFDVKALNKTPKFGFALTLKP